MNDKPVSGKLDQRANSNAHDRTWLARFDLAGSESPAHLGQNKIWPKGFQPQYE